MDSSLIIEALQRGNAQEVIQAINGQMSLGLESNLVFLDEEGVAVLLCHISHGMLICLPEVFDVKKETASAAAPELDGVFLVLGQLRETGDASQLAEIGVWAKGQCP